MNAKAVFPCALVLAILGAWTARGQDLYRSPYTPDTGQPAKTTDAPPDKLAPPASLSNWITYCRPDCCGPFGGSGPIDSELYARTGWSIPEGRVLFHQVLETGWLVSAGGRVLFFDRALDAAWTVDLGLSYVYNHGQRDDIPIRIFDVDPNNPGTVVTRDVTVRSLHRTFVNVALGRQWYLTGPTNDCDWRWRAGVDVGGRYGTLRVDVDEFGRRSFFRFNDVIGGLFAALHSDVEVPCGCCSFLGGLRMEFDYTWSDVFQPRNDSDLFSLNILFNLGVRF